MTLFLLHIFLSICNTIAVDNFIYKATSGSKNIGSIDKNHWGNGDGSRYSGFPSDGNNPFENVTYTFNLDTTFNSTSGVACGLATGGPIIDPDKKNNTAHPVSLDSLTCIQIYGLGYQLNKDNKFQESYDTLKYYIENCALEKDSRYAFPLISSANQYRNNGHVRYAQCREWLKKVLYYNLDLGYYCADVGAILHTFNWFNDVRGNDTKGAIAVINYLLESGKCASDSFNRANLEQDVREGWDICYTRYKDTVKDETLTPFDSTLPTLEDLNLEILRGQNSVHSSPKQGEENILNAHASINPFTNETMLLYTLRKNTMIHIEIFDVLGRTIHSMGEGRQTEGQHQILINGKDWNSGVYYARIITSGGETKTVKVIKE